MRIETHTVPALIKIRWRTRLKIWWMRRKMRRDYPRALELYDAASEQFEHDFLFGEHTPKGRA